jgi:tetratricopeptide (TPR) repeat protein
LDEDRTKEALEQYYLPYGKPWLDRPLGSTTDSFEAQKSYITHELVGWCELKLGRPTNALPQFEEAFQWKKMLLEQEPNNARYARDWSEVHSDLGKAQIAFGRLDEGLANLDEAVRLAEPLVERDPLNGSSQNLLVGVLQDDAEGCSNIAGSPGISRARQAELWQREITVLTRCQEKLDSPQLKQASQSQLTRRRDEIGSALRKARDAYAKLSVGTETNSPSQ